MDAITMPQTDSPRNIIAAFPTIYFRESDIFRWLPGENIIEFDPTDSHITARLLHEIAHAELKHTSYNRDISLIAMERDAWHYAKITLAPTFGITISADTIEDDLDTYRDWLHARSTCPHCLATGIQTGDKEYTCIACRTVWNVNQAIGCDLRRYVKKHP